METAARTTSSACSVAPPDVAGVVMASVGGGVTSGLPVAPRTAPLGAAVMNVGSTEISPSGGVAPSVGIGVAAGAGALGAGLSTTTGSAASTAGTTDATIASDKAMEAMNERFTWSPSA